MTCPAPQPLALALLRTLASMGHAPAAQANSGGVTVEQADRRWALSLKTVDTAVVQAHATRRWLP